MASVITPIAVLAWLVTGPMKAGWARHAGTPAAIIAGNGSATTTGSGTGAASAASGSATAWQPPFSASLAGNLSQTGPDAAGESTIVIDATLAGGASGKLHVVLKGPASTEGGVQMQQSSATLGPTSQPARYQGAITALQGSSMTIGMRDGAGHALVLAVQLQTDQSGNVTGAVQATGG